VARERVPVVTADNPSKGLPNAPVTLQIFGDFQCPACAQAEPSFVRIEQRYQARLRVVWRNLPLARHARARPAARAAVAAFRLGGNKAFWQLHDWFYSSQADLSDAGLRSVAAKLGLDPARLEQAANGTQYDASLAADEAAADRGDVQGTPAVFINDYYLIGGRDEAQYALVIERALREAGAVN
jgi:protein-disulfide isomerase